MADSSSLALFIGKKAAMELIVRSIKPFIDEQREQRFQFFVNALGVATVEEAQDLLQERPERTYEILERVRTAFAKEAAPVLARLLIEYRGKEPDTFYFQVAQLLPQVSARELAFMRVFFHVAVQMREPVLSRRDTEHPLALTGDIRVTQFDIPSDDYAIRVLRLLTQQGVTPETGSKRLDDAGIRRWNSLLNQESPPKPADVIGEASVYWPPE